MFKDRTPQLLPSSSNARATAVAIISLLIVAAAIFSTSLKAAQGQSRLPLDPVDGDERHRAIATTQLSPSTTSQPNASATQPVQSAKSSPATFYGLWSLAPAFIAIILAMMTRQVIVAMAVGILVAAGMMCGIDGNYDPTSFVTYAVDHYLIGVLAKLNDSGGIDTSRLKIIFFTLFIGAMIGVMEANGGTRAVVDRIARHIRSRRGAQLGALGSGFLVFFDDYATAMILGPGLRPVFDRLGFSRAKLSYIINTVAVTIVSIFLGTWLAMQISFIDDGLHGIRGQMPDFLANINATTIFWACIRYRTYTLLALVMVFWIAVTGRDFGPMRKAETASARKFENEKLAAASAPVIAVLQDLRPRWYLAVIPALVLVGMTVTLMITTGLQGAAAKGITLQYTDASTTITSIGLLLAQSDSHHAMLYASLTGAFVAIVLTIAARFMTLAKTMDGAVKGMTHMFAACIMLVLAWGLARASNDLEIGPVAKDFLQRQVDNGVFSISWIPLSSFLTACILSFSIGTSWGTMSLLLPPVTAICVSLFAGLPQDQALQMFYASIGGVMAGAVFGNNCSPLSDTTVLSAIFCDCDLGEHVRTQLPYGLTVLVVSVICTDGINHLLAAVAPDVYTQYWNVWYSLGLGAILLLVAVLLFGRRLSLETSYRRP